MRIRALKYLSPFIIYIGALHSFSTYGLLCFAPLIYAWLVIPLLELFIHPDPSNLTETEEEMARHDRVYDLILYLVVMLQIPTLFYFLYTLQDPLLSAADIIGRTGTMGLLCGTFGINVGHELGHRSNKMEQTMAKMLLLTSLYMHFFIEHNKGHHKRVATPEDPSSARYGETVFHFWIRSIVNSYISAWHIAAKDQQKKNRPVWNLRNEMLQFQVIQTGFIAVIYMLFGLKITLLFLGAALMGALLLETVNYIEHYGLQRRAVGEGRYERAMPQHSWNSNHVIGRVMLFELSRHSDHHFLASRKYQVLRHHDDAPQMPTGYPGMMMLSLLPPVWFHVMNRRVKQYTSPQSTPSNTGFAADPSPIL